MKPYTFTKPNYGPGVRHRDIRMRICPKYIGTDGDGKPGIIELLTQLYMDEWRVGNYDNDFQGHKPARGATKQEAKLLFDRIHGALHWRMSMELIAENEKEPANKREPDMDKQYDLLGNVLAESRTQYYRKRLDDMKLRHGIDVEAFPLASIRVLTG